MQGACLELLRWGLLGVVVGGPLLGVVVGGRPLAA